MKLLSSTGTLTEVESRENIIVSTTDGKRYAANRAVFKLCEFVNDILEDAEAGVVEIPLEMESSTLVRIYEYAEHHQHDALPPKAFDRPLKGELKSYLDLWDWRYVEETLLKGNTKMINDDLFSVLHAATFLGYNQLRELVCAAIASVLQNRTESELLQMFSVKEFSEEDENQLMKEFPWLQE